MATITLKLADGSDQKIILTKTVSTVGRDPENDIVINDESVSGHHAEIRLEDGRHILKDLGSTNGLRVNGERAMESVLNDGDLLRFGGVSGSYAGAKAVVAAPPKPEPVEEPTPPPAAEFPSGTSTSPLAPGIEPRGFGKKASVKRDSKQSAVIGLGVFAILACIAAMVMSVTM